MAITPDIADKVVEIVLFHVSRGDAINMIEELEEVDGGQSFNETIKLLKERIVSE